MSASSPTRRRLRPELFLEVPVVIVTFVMMLHITANALLRAFANRPLANTLEITQYWYLPIVAFLGFIAAQHRGQHVAADLVYQLLPPVTKRFVLGISFLVVAVVSVGFAWFGLQEALHSFDIRRTAGVSDLPAWPPYFLVPLAFGSLSIQFTYAGLRALRYGEGVDDPAEADVAEPTLSVDGGR
ncbi:TRAP transporter small permease [Aeromicrobium sp. YIM 150415]|uniref:TRAP transporter small permease n=1 Tax=Aeromicrobium sp. YIM 150415 TaxID=2803912 RepID=UPI001962FCF8|nr:TRAP transporter small permease [Aeromicrobium sp. YIM 150415]MBM9465593.1 TRAP transporter small permease [Aeromicrobium sp. YIM 150415]